MSLYYVQKYLYRLNRDEQAQMAHRTDPRAAVLAFVDREDEQALSAEEQQALIHGDVGRLYHLGVNGQILMHFAAFSGIEWADYLERMRQGIRDHGPVREGVYAMTTGLDEAPGVGIVTDTTSEQGEESP